MTEITKRKTSGGHAMVIGASVAGLLAARVLSEHFETVTLVERDRLPTTAMPRKGVPQSRHFHILLMRGQAILERLFPGFRAQLAGAGAVMLDGANDLAWYTPAGWGVRFRSDLVKIGCTRDLVEWTLRRRVLARPGIRLLAGVAVRELLAGASGQLGGALIYDLHGEREPTVLEADLMVDASGRGSALPRWLEQLDIPRPEESVVDAHVAYASQIYRRPPGAAAGWQALFIQAAPPRDLRQAVIFPVEGDRWMVSAAGAAGDHPPTSHRDFLEFLRGLPCPDVHRALAAAEPLGDVHGYRATGNRLRHLERLARWPDNLIALGDAVCSFNPVYGQGITVAALGAEELDRCLRGLRRRRGRYPAGLGRLFQRRLAKINAAPWLMTTGEDCRFPGVEGMVPSTPVRLMHRYMDRVFLRTTEDARVRRTFLEVQHMLRPPTALFRPTVLARVATASRSASRGGEKSLPVGGINRVENTLESPR